METAGVLTHADAGRFSRGMRFLDGGLTNSLPPVSNILTTDMMFRRLPNFTDFMVEHAELARLALRRRPEAPDFPAVKDVRLLNNL